MIRGERKDGGFKLEMSNMERVILSMILHYRKEDYFKDLEEAADRGPSMIHPDLIKETYNKILEATEL